MVKTLLTKVFGSGEQRVYALRGVDWDVFKGQMSLIVGPSGCGKTTLLSVVAGILKRDRFVLSQLVERGIPTVMLPSGGYTRESYRLIADSIADAFRTWPGER